MYLHRLTQLLHHVKITVIKRSQFRDSVERVVHVFMATVTAPKCVCVWLLL